MAFEYYYGKQADQYSFIKVPKLLVHDKAFIGLSVDAKMLYGLLLDRMSLSMKNGWLDEENRVYIIYQIKDIMSDMNMARATAVKYLQELVDFGLVEKRKEVWGFQTYYMLKVFLWKKKAQNKKKLLVEGIQIHQKRRRIHRSSTIILQEVQKLNYKEFNNYTSGSSENEIQEVQELDPNNTNINNTKNIDTNILSYPLTEGEEPDMIGADNWMHKKGLSITMPKADRMGLDKKKSEYELYMDLIKDNIEYDALKERYPLDAELIDGIVEMMTEVTVSTNDYIVIASNSFPKEVVKSRFLKLNFSHLEYVMSCFKSNTTKVKNIKKYLLASLFNAPSTMNGYYTAEVNHDMPQYASRR